VNAASLLQPRAFFVPPFSFPVVFLLCSKRDVLLAAVLAVRADGGDERVLENPEWSRISRSSQFYRSKINDEWRERRRKPEAREGDNHQPCAPTK